MEEEEEVAPSINFVPCVKWIRRGVAKSHPTKIELTKQELEDVIKGTKKSMTLGEDDEDSGTEADTVEVSGTDEYSLEGYDDEESSAAMRLGDVAVFDENLQDDGPDSDEDDDVIKQSDNLLAVGHVEGDASILEIYVYNEEEGSLYVHHDVPLPSIPLTLEWLNYDPADVHRPGNLCAVGMMSPIIEVWDVDIVNCIEPAFRLGRKASRKKHRARVGHGDAVLDLSWNLNLNHIMASGSVDQTVLLWDLETQEPSLTLDPFSSQVQTLEWHPCEGQTLLTGSSDKLCRVFDCRSPSSCQSWRMAGEVERVLWNHMDPFCFLASDDKGFVSSFDCRLDAAVWTLEAHAKEVTGLRLSCRCPGLLATASQDQTLKVWDLGGAGGPQGQHPVLVATRPLRVGDIQCLDTAPDHPFLLAAGGDNKSKNLIVNNVLEHAAVHTQFGGRELADPVYREGSQPSTSSGSPTSFSRKPIEKRSRISESSLTIVKKKKKFKKAK